MTHWAIVAIIPLFILSGCGGISRSFRGLSIKTSARKLSME